MCILLCFKKIRGFIEHSANRDNLEAWFDNRLLYVIVTTAISGYFNPTNLEKYATLKSKFKTYMAQPIVANSLRTSDQEGIGKQ